MLAMEKRVIIVCSQYASFRLLILYSNQWNKT